MQDKIAYNYCSTGVLMSIFENKKLWLSDMTKSNDYLEICGYYTLVLESLKQKLYKYQDEKNDRVKPSQYGKKVRDRHDRTDLSESIIRQSIQEMEMRIVQYHCLAICFSKLSDSLSQWRAYGDDGKGVAIGFSTDVFEQLIRDINPANSHSFYFREVEYYDGYIKNIDIMVNELAMRTPDQPKPIQGKKVKEWVYDRICREAPFRKTTEFEAEQEIRLCWSKYINSRQYSEIQQIQFRYGSNMIIPYIQLDISNYIGSIIREIIVGPCNGTNERTIQWMAARCGVNIDTIKKSGISYVCK